MIFVKILVASGVTTAFLLVICIIRSICLYGTKSISLIPDREDIINLVGMFLGSTLIYSSCFFINEEQKHKIETKWDEQTKMYNIDVRGSEVEGLNISTELE